MAERSFSQLPISSSHGGRRMMNARRGVFPVSEYWIHAIPVIIFLCFFTLWFFSHSVSLDENSGEIMSVRLLEKSMAAVRNESHVSLAVLASSAVSPVSANVTLAAHRNATQSRNATDTSEIRKREETKAKGKKKKKKSKGRKEKMERDVNKSKSVKKAKKSLAG